jgi:hypothetical protein
MRMAVERFDLSESDGETWAFLCECDDVDCQDWVTLPVKSYEALQRTDQPILAPGHTLGARALEVQAHVQVEPAKRNAKKKKPS